MELSLMHENRRVGFVSCEKLENYTVLTAVCQVALDGIWRAYLIFGGREVLIGVLTPSENGWFAAKKTYFGQITECDVHAEIRFGKTISNTSEEWVPVLNPELLFEDRALRASLARASGVLGDHRECPARIAVPLLGECGCAPALCLAQFMEYRGIAYAVLEISEKLGTNGNRKRLNK